MVFHNVDGLGMLLSQPALGKLMGIDGQSVARWEKTSKVPRWADKLVRLLYTAHAEGNEPIAKAVERIKTVERLAVKPLSCKLLDRTQRRAMALSPATPRPRGIHSWTVFGRPQSCALVGGGLRSRLGRYRTARLMRGPAQFLWRTECLAPLVPSRRQWNRADAPAVPVS